MENVNRSTDPKDARIAVLEHALRRASEKFSWLAEHHTQGAFAPNACRKLSHEFWNIQAGITS